MESPFLWEPHSGLGRKLSSPQLMGAGNAFGCHPHYVCLQKFRDGFTAPDVFIGTSVLQIYSRNKAKLCIN